MTNAYLSYLDNQIRNAVSADMSEYEKTCRNEYAKKNYENAMARLDKFKMNIENNRRFYEIHGMTSAEIDAWFVRTYAMEYISLLQQVIDAKDAMVERNREELLIEKIQYLESLV